MKLIKLREAVKQPTGMFERPIYICAEHVTAIYPCDEECTTVEYVGGHSRVKESMEYIKDLLESDNLFAGVSEDARKSRRRRRKKYKITPTELKREDFPIDPEGMKAINEHYLAFVIQHLKEKNDETDSSN